VEVDAYLALGLACPDGPEERGVSDPMSEQGRSITIASDSDHVYEGTNGEDPFPRTLAVRRKGETETHYTLLFHRPRSRTRYTRLCSSRSLHLD
jgi:hypothetical protein